MEILKLQRLRKRNKDSIWNTSPFGWDKIKGVYCVCTCDDDYNNLKVWYVGSSGNIGKRLYNRNHPYYVLFSQGLWPFIKFAEVSNYKELEKRIISLLSPPMNKQHNRHKKNKNLKNLQKSK